MQELSRVISVGSNAHTSALFLQHPARGLEHWTQEASKIKKGMTSIALMRYIPAASVFTQAEFIDSPISSAELICYAVDSELAIVVRMSYTETAKMKKVSLNLGRVEEVVGFFRHNGKLTDLNTLESRFYNNLKLADRLGVAESPED